MRPCSRPRSGSTSGHGSSSPSSSCTYLPIPHSSAPASALTIPPFASHLIPCSVASTRRNLGLVILFFFLTITFALLGAGEFSAAHGVALAKAGGAFGIVTALVAFYVGTAEMLADPAQSWFRLPLGQIPKGRVD